MNVCVGQDGQGMPIYKSVTESPAPVLEWVERRWNVSRHNDEELLRLCKRFETILDDMYRELRHRAKHDEDAL